MKFVFLILAMLGGTAWADFMPTGNPTLENGVYWQEFQETDLGAVGGSATVAQGGFFESNPFDIRAARQGLINVTIVTTVANGVTCGLRGMDMLKVINVPSGSNYLVQFLSAATSTVGTNELVFSWSEYSSQSYRQVNGSTNAVLTAPIFGACPFLKFRIENVSGAASFQINRCRVWLKN